MKVFLLVLRRRIRFFIGKHRKPLEIAFRSYVRGPKNLPCCPRCRELVYCETQCVMCGQRFLPGSVTVGSLLDKKAEA
jgi:hypothetical protein